MRPLISFFKWVIGLAFAACATLAALIAIGALFGFIHPLLDFFNHLQPLLAAATLAGIVLAPVFVRLPRLRAYVTAIAATGLLASALIIVPEAASRLTRQLPPEDGRPVYKLMTRNLFGRNYDMQRTADAIAAEDPDILAFQEYFPPQRERLHPLLADTYPYFTICQGGKRENIAIYARIPFEVTGGACESDGRTARIAAHFRTPDGGGFTVMTTHLDWPVQVSRLEDGTLAEGLDAASVRQRNEFSALADAVNAISGPLVLVADFNATSWSYALRDFQQAAGLERHTRSLPTFPTRFYIAGWHDVPSFLPLDHVMTRGGMSVHSIHAGDPAGSDHKPVIASFSVGQ